MTSGGMRGGEWAGRTARTDRGLKPSGPGVSWEPGLTGPAPFGDLTVAFSELGTKPYWFSFEIWIVEATRLGSESHLLFHRSTTPSGRLMWEPMFLRL